MGVTGRVSYRKRGRTASSARRVSHFSLLTLHNCSLLALHSSLVSTPPRRRTQTCDTVKVHCTRSSPYYSASTSSGRSSSPFVSSVALRRPYSFQYSVSDLPLPPFITCILLPANTSLPVTSHPSLGKSPSTSLVSLPVCLFLSLFGPLPVAQLCPSKPKRTKPFHDRLQSNIASSLVRHPLCPCTVCYIRVWELSSGFEKMLFLHASTIPKSFPPFKLFPFQNPTTRPTSSLSCVARKSDPLPESNSNPKAKPKKTTRRHLKVEVEAVQNGDDENPGGSKMYPETIPRKPRRGRRSEAVAVEDFVRDSLQQTFTSIREQNPEVFKNKEKVMKDRVEGDKVDDGDGGEDENEDEDGVSNGSGKKKMVVEEESASWPLDADVGWGIRASEYFEQHSIKNIVGEDGVEIDWEGEVDDNWVKEINCLEWESFAFHPSPLIVLVFERYNRAADNWKALKELEKALHVYWSAQDRLPPRSVKIDINIERDLAYALKAKECPQILFLRGNKILYREKEFRTADELVQMIAHFYYNAKRPSWIDVTALLAPPY